MFVKKGQIELSPLLDNLLATLIVNLILVPLLYIHGINLSAGKEIWPFALIAAVMYSIFYYVLSKGSASTMISLINAYPIVTIALAIISLHEFPNIYQWAGIIITLVGIICISEQKAQKKSKKNSKIWILWGLLGAFTIGVAEFATKVATLQVDGFTFTFFVYLMYIPPLLFFLFFDKKGRKFVELRSMSGLFFTCVGIFFIEGGLISIALAYQNGLAILVSPIVATNMLITVLLAVYFLRDKIVAIQKIGIVLIVIGVSIIGV